MHTKLSKGASTQVLPCLEEKVGRCADIKRRGRRGALERKEALLLAVKSQAQLLSFVTFFLRFEAHVSGVSQVK